MNKSDTSYDAQIVHCDCGDYLRRNATRTVWLKADPEVGYHKHREDNEDRCPTKWCNSPVSKFETTELMKMKEELEEKAEDVVNIEEQKSGAFLMGHKRFKGIDVSDHTDEKDMVEEIYSGVRDSLPQSSEWVNGILPDLRAMAGYEDGSGVGTYTEPQTVYVKPDGEVANSRYLRDELVDTFWKGVRKTIEEEVDNWKDRQKEQI